MSEEKEQEKGGWDKDYILELCAAVILGVATMLGAYAAYQSSLWGGNCQTAYNAGTNKLGEANRELLRGVQERAFDTTLWLEQLKAQAVQEAVAAEQDGDEAETAETGTEERAMEIIGELLVRDELPYPQKLSKLLATRRELSDAMKWADTSYEKKMKSLTEAQMKEMVVKIMGQEKEAEDLLVQQFTMLQPLGVDEDSDEEDIEEALAKDEGARKKYESAEVKWVQLSETIEKEYDKLSKPMFFESPEYVKKTMLGYKSLLEDGNKLVAEGQQANQIGDKFTLTTVLFTVTLFFAGLSSTLRRRQIKAIFLAMSVVVLVYSLIQMFTTPFA